MANSELELLSNIIIRRLKEEFSIKKLSGNLINTITVEQGENDIKINIPAQTYNMLLYQSKGVVVHTSHGSYASKLDEEGSEFYVYPEGTRKGSRLIKPHNHKGYINKVINEAIQEWQRTIKNKVIKVEG